MKGNGESWHHMQKRMTQLLVMAQAMAALEAWVAVG